MSMRIAYHVRLTKDEYRSACVMSDRGYLGELIECATWIEDTEDGTEDVILGFTEPDAWQVLQVCEDDPIAVWSLTTPGTTLGQKFQQFLDSIV